MKWIDLKRYIEKMSPERRQDDVVVYIHDYDETWPVTGIAKVGDFATSGGNILIIDDPCGGVLDDGTLFLVAR